MQEKENICMGINCPLKRNCVKYSKFFYNSKRNIKSDNTLRIIERYNHKKKSCVNYERKSHY